jgi:hypothetical protein
VCKYSKTKKLKYDLNQCFAKKADSITGDFRQSILRKKAPAFLTFFLNDHVEILRYIQMLTGINTCFIMKRMNRYIDVEML